eukprot:scaffold242074_cov16-Prasinocladus_malaysianus.AAC.3
MRKAHLETGKLHLPSESLRCNVLAQQGANTKTPIAILGIESLMRLKQILLNDIACYGSEAVLCLPESSKRKKNHHTEIL